MTTLRIAKRRGYVQLDARAVNDPLLSYRALGVLTWLLEKPDDWTVRAESIAAAKKEGRDAVRTALAELEAAGYLVRLKTRDAAGIWRSESVIYESPQAVDNQGDNAVDNQADHDGKPALVNRCGKPGPITKKKTQEETKPPNPQQAGGTKPANRRAAGTNPRAATAQLEAQRQATADAVRVIHLASGMPDFYPLICARVADVTAEWWPRLVALAATALERPESKDWAQAADWVEDRVTERAALTDA